MGSIATIFFICVFTLLVGCAVLYDFTFWLLIAFAGALVFILSLSFTSDDSRPRESTWSSPIDTRQDPSRFERNLRGRIEDEYYDAEDFR
ncbi:hypothetical protein [Nitrosarchaeum sp. AC2]|uniref:hypothetical protein n=1 Tax=Nitrosarchaeum sp. AC2 TaxID=2259673 RepID=UPI0015C7C4E0|nr:hypothetical protein [Nitrosarchaeum sp. AC2]QLH11231.1 hypothetical protein DSQ20_07000 [Nitrosarchaeum sp. AC2]